MVRCSLFIWRIDNLPVRGFVGTFSVERRNGVEYKQYYLFKHLNFHILYNGEQVIHANATVDPNKLQELGDDEMIVEFSYSAKWEETGISSFHF